MSFGLLEFMRECWNNDTCASLTHILLAIILALFYWFAGGRDFLKKIFTYQDTLPLRIIFDCSSNECDLLANIAKRLAIHEAAGKEYISPVLYNKNYSSSFRNLESLAYKGYLVKVVITPLTALETAINEIRPKSIEMNKGYQYYLITSKFSKAICGLPTRSDDFIDSYEEF